MLRATGGIQPLQSLLSSLKFAVPDFQRNYAWEDRQIEEFWSDLEFTVARPKISHFVGSVILLTDSQSDRALVIDGQQRLTTIMMTLGILRDIVATGGMPTLQPDIAGALPINVLFHLQQLLFADGEPRFEANPQIKKRFLDCVVRNPIDDPSRESFKKSEQSESLRLRKAYWLLEKRIREYIDRQGGDDPTRRLRAAWDITKATTQRLEILRIDCEDQLEAINIYMTLNNRGLGLTPADLLKSLIMKHLGSGLTGDALHQQNSYVVDSWSDMVDLVGEQRLNQFLRHYLLVYGPTSDSIREKDIFKYFQEIVEGASPLTDSQMKERAASTFLSLQKIAKLYGQIVEPETTGFSKKTKFKIRNLNEVMDSHRVFLVAALDTANIHDASKFDHLVNLVDVIAMRWVLGGENAQMLENLFQKTARSLRESQESFGDRIDAATSSFRDQCPNDETMQNRLRESSFSVPLARAILSRLNEELHHFMGVIDYAAQKVNIEHVAPQTPSDFWYHELGLNPSDPGSAVAYKELTTKIGNLVLLEYKLNSAIKNAEWEIKRYGVPGQQDKSYAVTVLKVAIDVRDVDRWTVHAIEARTEWISQSFIDTWTYSAARPVSSFVF